MKRRGFTILELIVAMVLTGLFIGITTPALAKAYRRWAVRTTADEFVAAHGLTRSIAVWQGRTAELHIDDATGRFWVEVDTGTVGVVKDTVGIVRGAKKWVDIAVTPGDRDVICFDSRGLPSRRTPCDPADATIEFRAGDRVATVTSTRLGKILR